MNADILRAIMEYIDAAAGIPPVLWPNVSADPGDTDHLILSILPAPAQTVGLNSTVRYDGIIQILIRTGEGTGALVSAAIADDVLALFPRNTELTSGGVTVRINLAGWVSPALNSDGWYALPVSIPYTVIQ